MPRPFPPVATLPLAEQDGRSFVRLVELMQRLLADDGCPWDREQTFSSLRRFVLEEACEVIDAIDSGDRQEICAELGDLMLQVVFQAELARKEGAFGPDDVVRAIVEKLVHRHPHVFGDEKIDNAAEVLQNWERIKLDERSAKGDKRTLLAGVPRSLPALTRAQRVGEKVARVGFDWPDHSGSRQKLAEELAELDRAIATGDAQAIEEEVGDLLFAAVNLARHLTVDSESALRHTIDKFIRRFAHVESCVERDHGGFGDRKTPLPLDTLDSYWEQAKRLERGL